MNEYDDSNNSLLSIDEEAMKFLNEYKEQTESDTEGEVLMKALSIMQWYFHFEDKHYVLNEETEQFQRVSLEFTENV